MQQRHVIDLFCGAGGFSTGAKKANIKVILAVDSDVDALDIHKQNHPTTKHLNMLLGTAAARQKLIDHITDCDPQSSHIHASPPCTSYSLINTRTRSKNKGDRLVDWTMQLIVDLQPKSWTIENVPAAAKHIIELATKHGLKYNFAKIFSCQKFGVPCIRKRFLMGGGAIESPDSMSVPKILGADAVIHDPYFTHTFVNITSYKKGGLSQARKKHLPCQSFTTKNRPSVLICHNEDDLQNKDCPQRGEGYDYCKMYEGKDIKRRLLSDAEVGALMSFPQNYIWKTKNGKFFAVKGAGNCVPPDFAKFVCLSFVNE